MIEMVRSERLTTLVYELLDAHDDTARIAQGLAPDDAWEAHLRYLRDLQRVGASCSLAAARRVAR